MSNKSDRKEPHTVYGRLSGEPETSRIHDRRLNPGHSLNGKPALIMNGDTQTSLLSVRCHCGSVVAEVWRVDRTTRGQDPLLYIESQIIDDPLARPVGTRKVDNLIGPAVNLLADCVVHGRHEIAGASVLRELRRATAKNARGKMGIMNLGRDTST